MFNRSTWRLYLNRRVLSLLILGFSSGLPLVLIGSTLQAWYTMAGVSVMTVGFLSLVGQPYSWKFLWAPLLDRFSLFGLGRRQGWILLCQSLLVASLVVMASLHPTSHPVFLAMIALFAAFCSASQDTAIDAYRTDRLRQAEQGAGAAMYSLGYRIALLIAGAMALIAAHALGWRTTYFLMAGLMALSAVITLCLPRVSDAHRLTLRDAVILPWRCLLSRPYAGMILVFIVTYKLTDAFALSLNSYFLLHVLHFSLIDLGEVSKIAGMAGVILGSILGGLWYPRLGLFRSLLYFGVLQAASALLFIGLTIIGKNYSMMALSVFGENFCSGLSSVAFIVYLTTLCNRRYSATQYAAFSAIASLGRVTVGPLAAYCVKLLGWTDLYLIACGLGFVPLGVLIWLSQRDPTLVSADAVEDVDACANVIT